VKKSFDLSSTAVELYNSWLPTVQQYSFTIHGCQTAKHFEQLNQYVILKIKVQYFLDILPQNKIQILCFGKHGITSLINAKMSLSNLCPIITE
jgi:hypothetical protein